MNNEFYITSFISLLSFLGVVLLVEGVYLLFRGVSEEGSVKINRRLKALSAGGGHGKAVLDLLTNRTFSDVEFLHRILTSIPRMHALDRVLEQSGSVLSVSRFLLVQFVVFLLMFSVLAYLTALHWVVSLTVSLLVGALLPSMYVLHKKYLRGTRFTQQLPDALDFLARSMRAGNPLSASLKALAEEMPDPIGTEFGITFDEMNYGISLEDAMKNLGVRSGNEEMYFFITAVLIQRQTGGNLADVLNRIAAVMRARATTYRDIRILSSEMRLSAYVLLALPFIVAFMMMLTNPGYIETLTESVVGQMVITAQVVLMFFGYLIMRRMVNFRV